MQFASCPIQKITHGSKTFHRLISLSQVNISLLTADNGKNRKTQRSILNNKSDQKFVTTHQALSKKGKIIWTKIGAAQYSVNDNVEAVIEKENIWTIPNILCCSRIIASPYQGYLIYCEDFNTAFVIMVLAGLTDLLDGLIARNFPSQASKLGTFLDPMADKILISTICITLTIVHLMPVMLTALILTRDILLASAGFYIRYKSLPPPKTLARYFDATHATAKLEPTMISKFNTTVQLVAVGIGLMSPIFGFTDHEYLQYLWYSTASTTIASAVSYIYSKDTYKILKKD